MSKYKIGNCYTYCTYYIHFFTQLIMELTFRGVVQDLIYRSAVTHLAQSNGNYSKLLASVGFDKCVYIYDTTVCFGYI